MYFRRNILSIIILLAALFLFGFYLIDNMPEKIVGRTLKQVNAGNINNLKLDQADIEKIKSFTNYTTSHKQFEPPIITIRRAAKIKNRIEIIASFTWIEYGQDGQVIDNYTGSLLFDLIEISPFKWEIQRVEIIKNIS
ncbi:hypothetical protein [Thermoanaerobacterium sp. DL9XJH110]|uniref:hypothetical protein n=1 Tax=Thermoanaerobacterium sp. DL9XJH110 TaxID=3386643 RepID=UPI003BB54DB8